MTAPSCVRCGASLRSASARRSSGTASTVSRRKQLEQAQIRLLGVWKQKQLVSRRLLAYDTTNFYTYVASTNTSNELAQRGHNKQGRHNLRQVGLSYVMDGDNGLSLCHHVYPGNRGRCRGTARGAVAYGGFAGSQSDCSRHGHAGARQRLRGAGQHAGIGKGRGGLDLGFALEPGAGGTAGPKRGTVAGLRQCPARRRAAAEKLFVHGKEYLCVLKYSACFASEQFNSLTATLAKVTQKLRRLATELSKPQARFTEQGIRNKIRRWLSDPVRPRSAPLRTGAATDRWHLTFEVDNKALQQLWTQRLGRTVLLTNRMDWTAEQVVAGYSGQQQIERVFRGLKDGDWLGWGPMYHWTDSKIRMHAFYCMLGISLLQYIHRSPRRLAGSHRGTTAGTTAPDAAVRFAVSAARRQRSQSRRHCPLQADSCCSKLSLIPWAWTSSVVPNVGNTSRLANSSKTTVTALPSGLRVNSR